MSWPYLHTVIDHIPIVLVMVGALAIFLGLVIQRRGIWLYGLTSLTLAGTGIYPAWLTGNHAAQAVRSAWYVAPGAVRQHAVAADVTVWVVAGTAFIALVALITIGRSREAVSPARWLRWIVGLAALVDLGAVAYTSYLGGKVVIESPILMSPVPPAATQAFPQTSPQSLPQSSSRPAAPGQPVQPVQPGQPGTMIPAPVSPAGPPPASPASPVPASGTP